MADKGSKIGIQDNGVSPGHDGMDCDKPFEPMYKPYDTYATDAVGREDLIPAQNDGRGGKG